MLLTFIALAALAMLGTHFARLGMPKLGSAMVALYGVHLFIAEMDLPPYIDPPLYLGSIALMVLGVYLAAKYRRK